MTARRRLLAASSATLALAALTGCERPAPIVTLVSGGESTYTEATVFCFDEEQDIDSGQCATRADEITRLAVRPGETVGVDVAKEVVERGWELTLINPDNPQESQTSGRLEDDHYFTFTAPNIPEGGAPLAVQTVTEEGVPTGEWRFELVRRD